jgi:hypothetical protein
MVGCSFAKCWARFLPTPSDLILINMGKFICPGRHSSSAASYGSCSPGTVPLHVHRSTFSYTPLARPDSLGFLTFILCFWLLEVFPAQRWSMLAIVPLSPLGLLIKQYFTIIGPLVISYISFFRSRKAGLIFAVVFLNALVSTYALDHYLLPGYLPLVTAASFGGSDSTEFVLYCLYVEADSRVLWYILGGFPALLVIPETKYRRIV